MTKNDMNTASPWYKEPWMIFIVAVPAITVVLGITLLIVATVGRDTLVRDNYYKDGIAINQELGYESNAEELGLTAELSVDDTTGSISVRLMGSENMPDQLELLFLHPTLESRDQDVELHQLKAGYYAGSVESSLQGKYHIQLSSNDQQWRLKAYREFGGDHVYSLP